MPAVSDLMWSARSTTPGDIEAALRAMLKERHSENASYVPARSLNLVCIVDKQWSGEIANRLRHIGHAHAARTIVCAVEPKRETLDAGATIASDVHPQPGEFALLRETVVVDVGERHLTHIDTAGDPLVFTDLPPARRPARRPRPAHGRGGPPRPPGGHRRAARARAGRPARLGRRAGHARR